MILQRMLEDGSAIAPLPAIKLFRDIVNHIELLKRKRIFIKTLTCDQIWLTLSETMEIYFVLFEYTENDVKDNIPMVHGILSKL